MFCTVFIIPARKRPGPESKLFVGEVDELDFVVLLEEVPPALDVKAELLAFAVLLPSFE